MKFNAKFWLKFSLVNLLIVALIGLLMRYKIGFYFPFLDQKHLQHSHSHFAFSGWISHTLMVLMVAFLGKKGLRKKELENGFGVYNKILIANLICAYGMLVFFIIQGYGAFSILFSTGSIIVSCFFGYYFLVYFPITLFHKEVTWNKAMNIFINTIIAKRFKNMN
mgnify:CR=1 FL=1